MGFWNAKMPVHTYNSQIKAHSLSNMLILTLKNFSEVGEAW